jgi:monoamine oxidase
VPNSNFDYDVAIVGGGISGIYSGWRLLANLYDSPILRQWAGAAGKLKVAVFEGSDRIGGRLLSARPPGFPDTVCELGGMRYTSTQTLVRSLVQNELNLQSYQQVVDQPQNLCYLRGEQLRFSETQDAHNLPYNLDWAERQQLLPGSGNDPSGLIAWAIGQVLPGTLTAKSSQELDKYLQTVKVDGTPLYHHGFWNLLARAMSTEAYELARAMVGYDILGSNANAVDLIPEVFGFAPNEQFYMLNGGYDTVPWTLQKRFEEMGGEVLQNTWLAGFDKASLDGGETGVTLQFRGGRDPVTARAIILAMPRRSLEMLAPVGPVLDPAESPRFQKMLPSVEPVALYKLILAYSYPWWQNVGVSQGRSLTDIPLRQCYYWPCNTGAGPAKNTNGLIMTYNDQLNVDFWAGLTATGEDALLFERRQNDAPEPVNDFDKRLRQNWDDHKAPYEMVAEMHRQLMRMHGVQYAPKPMDAAFMDWTVDPYGAGVHFWNRGYKSWEILDEMTQPEPDFPCYICGEAYSTVQTWAEGALQTAEIVLQKHLGLPAPGWIIRAGAAGAAGA